LRRARGEMIAGSGSERYCQSKNTINIPIRN
jgi:hypothetical protein